MFTPYPLWVGGEELSPQAMPKVYERSVFLPDAHVPFQDNGALSTALAFLRYYKPQVVFQLGDLLDFYSLSRFDRNPDRILSLPDELEEAKDVLRRIREAAPWARFLFLRGNHEYRLTKYLWRKAPELSGLKSLKIEELLDLYSRRIEYIESGTMTFHDFVVKHGNLVRSKSGYTATGELEKVGTSGLSGHSHRLSQVYRRNVGGMFSWTECGCLCSLNPEYMEGQVPDWEHGLAYGTYERDGNRFEVHLAPIIKAKILFQGQEIAA